MKTITFILLAVLALGADPEFNKDGELVRPKNYREWIFLSAGVGMSYGAEKDPFTNVFVEPSAYRKFVETGQMAGEVHLRSGASKTRHGRLHQQGRPISDRLHRGGVFGKGHAALSRWMGIFWI